MKLIVGLGNPGPQYAQTRHNIGFMVVERLSRDLGKTAATWKTDTVHNVATATITEVLLVKPLTFMNKSGYAVKYVMDLYQVPPSDVWVIHDDIDLPLGKIRIRTGGASAGHGGVESIITQLKSEKFTRFRLGIGRGKESTGRQMDKNVHRRAIIDFVLSHFRQSEAGALKHLVERGTKAVRVAFTEGIDRAMHRFN